jgi:mevalonate kinase
VIVTASAPAKIILFGEHFVVYGEPAIATAIDRRARVTAQKRNDKRIFINSVALGTSGFFTENRFQAKQGGAAAQAKLEPTRIAVQRTLDRCGKETGVNVTVHSNIPVAAGLGSSAAVGVATAAAVAELFGVKAPQEEIYRTAYEAERFVHGTPSGIDPAVSTYGGVLLFRKKHGFTRLAVKTNVPLVVGNTGIERSTGGMVSAVRRRQQKNPKSINAIIKYAGKIALSAAEALKSGDLRKLGELMNANQKLLSEVGVSGEPLERLIHAARKAGASGAKLTGAGGGGCMIALCSSDKLKRIVDAIESQGGTAFVARKTDEGVRIEN